MTAHKRRHTTQPFALCKLSYTILRWNTQKHMDMIWARLCFYNFHSLLLTQLSQYLSDIFPDLTIYCHSPIFWCEYHMILASPCCVLQTFYIFFFHRKDLLVLYCCSWLTATLFYQKVFSLYNFFYSPRLSRGLSFR